MQVQTSGKVTVVTGVGTQGQGHFTVLAQVVAEQLGVEVEDVDVVTGDSDQFHWGTGTFASRGAVVAGNATQRGGQGGAREGDPPRRRASSKRRRGADRAGAKARRGSRASPSESIALGELAKRANPMRGAVKPGTEPGLEATALLRPRPRRHGERRATP